MTRSNTRWPRRFWTASSSSDTAPVITPPTSSGRSNSRCSAMAPPTTSARSVAMATNSACSQYAIRVGRAGVVGDGLGQRAPGDQAELGRQVLHQAGHRVGHHDDPHQQEAELRAGADVGGDVAGVDVGDGGDERRAEQQPARPQPRLGVRGPTNPPSIRAVE